MSSYAIVNSSSGTVTNIAAWDGVTPWSPGAGFQAVHIDGISPTPQIGWTNNPVGSTTFAAPAPVDPIVTTQSGSTIVQGLIDTCAQRQGYADGVACMTYINSSNPAWKAQATSFGTWRDAMWAEAYAIQAAVAAGQPAPVTSAFLALLPTMAWPS